MYNEHKEAINFCLSGKKPAFIIDCDTCGKRSVVSDEHKKYCPVCGPATITSILHTKYSNDPKAVFFGLNACFAKSLEYLDDKAFQRAADTYCLNCDYASEADCNACDVRKACDERAERKEA